MSTGVKRVPRSSSAREDKEAKSVCTTESADPAIPFISGPEHAFFVLLTLLLVPLLWADYFYNAFDSGESLFIPDLADMIFTSVYLRSTKSSLGWPRKMFPSLSVDLNGDKSKKSAFRFAYAFFSDFFFYCVAGQVTRSLILGDVSKLFTFCFDFRGMLMFFLFGFLPAYFAPNDYVFKMINENTNPTAEILGSAVWAVSKTDSLKRQMNLFYATHPVSQATLAIAFALVSCQVAAVLKDIEIIAWTSENGFDWDRFERKMVKMGHSKGLKATLWCCVALNMKYVVTKALGISLIAPVVLDLAAISGIFLRYSTGTIEHYRLADLEEFLAVHPNEAIEIKLKDN